MAIAAIPSATPTPRRSVNASWKRNGATSAERATPPPRTMVPVAETGPPRRSAAKSSVVAPLFHVSLQNGRGAELAEMSEKLLLTQPALAVARGQVLEYFSSQAEVAQKSIFNLPTKMNASFYIGKEGPLLSFVKSLCDLLGYDLNPDSEEKDASMDDQISFVEAATWYITHPKSPFQEHQPELFIYRDIVAIYKVSGTHRAPCRTVLPCRAKYSWIQLCFFFATLCFLFFLFFPFRF